MKGHLVLNHLSLQRLEALKNKDDSECDSDSVYCDVRILPRRSVKIKYLIKTKCLIFSSAKITFY